MTVLYRPNKAKGATMNKKDCTPKTAEQVDLTSTSRIVEGQTKPFTTQTQFVETCKLSLKRIQTQPAGTPPAGLQLQTKEELSWFCLGMREGLLASGIDCSEVNINEAIEVIVISSEVLA
jgi:hypothetical protein